MSYYPRRKENFARDNRLSVIGDDALCTFEKRQTGRLLRPIFINGVEVGYAYAESRPQEPGRDKTISVRGITIALWFFLSRGHQAQALLPHCFKTFQNKSDDWEELMQLHQMNLVEFTMGQGPSKYLDVNRILATRSHEFGGCIVARSQMHGISEEYPHLDRTIEKRLLMPSFNGTDIIFPMDGPLGRGGLSFLSTTSCIVGEPEYDSCETQQLNLIDQRIWLDKIAMLVPEYDHWLALASKIGGRLANQRIRPKLSTKPHPPETNPPGNQGFSKMKNHEFTARQVDYVRPRTFNNLRNIGILERHDIHGYPYYNRKPTSYNGLQADEFMPIKLSVFPRKYSSCPPSYDSSSDTSTSNESYARVITNLKPKTINASSVVNEITNVIGHSRSIYRFKQPLEMRQNEVISNHSTSDGSNSRANFGDMTETPANPYATDIFNKLSEIFGYAKSKAVIDRYPNVGSLDELVDKAISQFDHLDLNTLMPDEALPLNECGETVLISSTQIESIFNEPPDPNPTTSLISVDEAMAAEMMCNIPTRNRFDPLPSEMEDLIEF